MAAVTEWVYAEAESVKEGIGGDVADSPQSE